MQTKNYYLPDTEQIYTSEPVFYHMGYWNPIPWNDIYTSGWANTDPNPMRMWGSENKLLLRDDPEFFAPGDLIRSNVIPSINPSDPIFKFQRNEHEYKVW